MKKFMIGLAVFIMVFGMGNIAMASGILSPDAEANAVVGEVGASASITNITNGGGEQKIDSYGKGYRGFPEAANINYPGQPGYFGPVNKNTPRYTPVETLTLFNDSFTADQLDKMDTSGWGDVDFIVSPMVDEVDDEARAGAVRVYGTKPEGTVRQLGFATIVSDDNDVNSQIVLAAAAKEALKYGANAIYVTGEGAELVLKSSGWGIGLNTTVATLSGSETTGTIAGGGTGYSAGEAGYKDRPWLQIFILEVN